MPSSAASASLASPDAALLDDVLHGLGRPQKMLPSKYFYDAEGSRLFDAITELDTYYPTRTETAIMKRHVDAIVGAVGAGAVLVEYGSGSSVKTRVLLDHLPDLAAYVPIDISAEHLERTADELRAAYPDLAIRPVAADYTDGLTLPRMEGARTVVFFPGSTIGNFDPDDALAFLSRIADVAGPGGGLLIGVDLRKDPAVLEAAYDDPQGVTAAFNKNLLVRLNRELGADFDVDAFDHLARYDAAHGRIEMHLVSRTRQTVHVGDATFRFRAGETIHTENSYKYTLDGFAALAEQAGWGVRQVWTDDRAYFSVQYLEVRAG